MAPAARPRRLMAVLAHPDDESLGFGGTLAKYASEGVEVSLVLGTLGDVPVAVMRGRAHLYEGLSAERVVFGVRVLGLLGIRTLVVTNAAGGINPDYRPGLLVLISDHVNLQGASALVGTNDDALGPRFPDLSDAYDPTLRARARDAARHLGIDLGEGVYAAWLGPQFETPAESPFAFGDTNHNELVGSIGARLSVRVSLGRAFVALEAEVDWLFDALSGREDRIGLAVGYRF